MRGSNETGHKHRGETFWGLVALFVPRTATFTRSKHFKHLKGKMNSNFLFLFATLAFLGITAFCRDGDVLIEFP